ncbi:MAG: CPBP family intramembrane metalloprotease [Caulobacter sp.]|nr:CPBP family intramembrane metalloprotease [Caulobacter sp.]
MTLSAIPDGPGGVEMNHGRSAPIFFLLVLAFAVPLWLLSGRLGLIGALRIPASDLALAFTPMLVGLGLVAWREGWRNAARLLMRAFDVTSIRGGRWMAATLLIPPCIYLVSWSVMRLSGADHPIPTPGLFRLGLLLVLFLVLAAGEEVGWMGYAFGPLQQRFGALGASLLIAIPWWLGHLPSMSAIGVPAGDMVWWILGALALRIVMTWLYSGAGASLSAVVAFHALLNLSRIAIVPAVGAHYIGAYQAVAYLAVAVIAGAVIWQTRGRLATASKRGSSEDDSPTRPA